MCDQCTDGLEEFLDEVFERHSGESLVEALVQLKDHLDRQIDKTCDKYGLDHPDVDEYPDTDPFLED